MADSATTEQAHLTPEEIEKYKNSACFCSEMVMKPHPFSWHKHEGMVLGLCGGRIYPMENKWTCPNCGKDYSKKDKS